MAYEGCKKSRVLGICRILNLGSEDEGAREHLEEELEKKRVIASHESSIMADICTGYISREGQDWSWGDMSHRLGRQTSGSNSNPVLEFYTGSLDCWVLRTCRSSKEFLSPSRESFS